MRTQSRVVRVQTLHTLWETIARRDSLLVRTLSSGWFCWVPGLNIEACRVQQDTQTWVRVRFVRPL